jgi:outer membrane lipase/esterase
VEPILQHAPENRWGVWVTGFGDFVNVDGDGNAHDYDFTTGGVSLGIDYRLIDQLAIGVMGEHAHNWTSLNPSGHIEVDSGRGGMYATWFSHELYVNRAIYGGHNNYDSGRSGLGGLASGGTEGAEWSTFVVGGYDFHFGPLTIGPIASLVRNILYRRFSLGAVLKLVRPTTTSSTSTRYLSIYGDSIAPIV